MSAIVTFSRVERVRAIELHALEANEQMVDYQRLADELGWTIDQLSNRWPRQEVVAHKPGTDVATGVQTAPAVAHPGWWVELDDDRIVALMGPDYFDDWMRE